MRILDVSVPVRPGMVIYPGDPAVELERVESLAEGGIANISRLSFGVHTGTHVDAPLHFFDGVPAVEALPLSALVGPARVVEVKARGEIGAADLPAELPERLLLKTSNSALWERDEYVEGSVVLAADAAQLLVDRGVRLVGIDYLSIGGLDVHRILLGAGLIPVEGLDLRDADPGDYLLVCAPLKLVGSDGGPARVLLIRD